METTTDQQLQQQSDSKPIVEAVASQVSVTVETIPVAEVEKWLTEQIQPYLKRIERLEEIESKKDSQIHCMELALQRFQELIDQAKLAAPITHNKATNGVKTPATAVNGQKRPQTAAQPDAKEDKKPIVKPTVTKPVGTDHKSTTTGARPNTAAGLTSTEKKDDDEKKTPAVVPHKVVRTPVKKDETKGDEEKKETDKKIEKKPTTATATATIVKKEGEKDDKKTNAHPTKTPVTSTAAVTEKKPTGTSITGTPKPAVKKEDPKIKKDVGKEVTTGVKDDKKPVAKPNGVKPVGAKGKEEPKKTTEKKEEQTVVKPEEKKKDKVADTDNVKAELPAVISEVTPPTTIEKQVHEDEQLLDSKEPEESKPAEAEKPTLPADEEEESI